MTSEVPQRQGQENLRRILMPPKEMVVQQLKECIGFSQF